MNIVKILLVLGLGYVALTQKIEKTRNMLLVVTGLLAFCMFSVEGFDDITFTREFDGSGDGTTAQAQFNAGGDPVAANGELTVGGQITSSEADGRVYTFPVGFNVASGEGGGGVEYTCGDNEVKGAMQNSGSLNARTVAAAFPCVDKQLCSEADASLTCSSGTKKTGASDYCEGSTCVAGDFSGEAPACCELPAPNELCTEGETNLKTTCPEYYTPKANARCRGTTCVAADFNTTTKQCCKPVCPDSKCSFWEWLFWGDGDPCGYFSKCED